MYDDFIDHTESNHTLPNHQTLAFLVVLSGFLLHHWTCRVPSDLNTISLFNMHVDSPCALTQAERILFTAILGTEYLYSASTALIVNRPGEQQTSDPGLCFCAERGGIPV